MISYLIGAIGIVTGLTVAFSIAVWSGTHMQSSPVTAFLVTGAGTVIGIIIAVVALIFSKRK